MAPRKNNQKLAGDTPPSDLIGKDVIAVNPRTIRATRSSTHSANPAPFIDVADITEGQNAPVVKQKKPRRTKEEIEAEKIDTAKRREEKAEKKRKREEAAAAAKEVTAQKRLAAEADRKEKLEKLKKLELDSEMKNKEDSTHLDGVLIKKGSKAKSVSKNDAKAPTKTRAKALKQKGCESEASCESEEGEILDVGDVDEDLIPSKFIMVSTKRRASIHDPDIVTEVNSNMSTDEDSIETLVPVPSTRTKASSKPTPEAPTADILVPVTDSQVPIISPASEDTTKAENRKIIVTAPPRNSADPGDDADSNVPPDEDSIPLPSKRSKVSLNLISKARAADIVAPEAGSQRAITRPASEDFMDAIAKKRKTIPTVPHDSIDARDGDDSNMLLGDSIVPMASKCAKGSSKPTPKAVSTNKIVPSSRSRSTSKNLVSTTKTQKIILTMASSDVEMSIEDGAAECLDLDEKGDDGVDEYTQNRKGSAEAEKRYLNKRNISPASQDHGLLIVPARPSNWRALAFRGRPPSRSASPSNGTNRDRSASVSSWSGISESASRAASVEAEATVKPQLPQDVVQTRHQVSKRVTTATTVKVKVKDEPAEDLPLRKTRSKKSVETKSKRHTMDDIAVDRRVYREEFVPTVLEFMMTLDNPFDIHDLKALPAIQGIFNFIFPDDKYELTEDDPVVFVVIQRFIEHRSKVAKFADAEVKEFFEREENRDELYRRNYVTRALRNLHKPDFIWKNFMLESYFSGNLKGLFRNCFITRTVGYHLFEIRESRADAPPIVESGHPKGPVSVASCAVERALKCWKSGVYQPEAKKPFSADNYLRRVGNFGKMTVDMQDEHWDLLIRDSCDAFRAILRERKAAEDLDLETDCFSGDDSDVSDLAALDVDSELEELKKKKPRKPF